MSEQLDRIEQKLNDLLVLMERQRAAVEMPTGMYVISEGHPDQMPDDATLRKRADEAKRLREQQQKG